MAPLVRAAIEKDLDAVIAIHEKNSQLPRWSREHFVADMTSHLRRLRVIEDGGAVKGYASLGILPPEAELLMIVVDPAVTRRGLGRQLLTDAFSIAKAESCGVLRLEVSEANVGALHLYQGAGFRIVGRRTKYYNHSFDAVLMEIRL